LIGIDSFPPAIYIFYMSYVGLFTFEPASPIPAQA